MRQLHSPLYRRDAACCVFTLPVEKLYSKQECRFVPRARAATDNLRVCWARLQRTATGDFFLSHSGGVTPRNPHS